MNKKHKNLILNQAKLNLAREILGTKTDAETIELALDSIISDAERNNIAFNATQDLLRSGIEVKDVFGNLED